MNLNELSKLDLKNIDPSKIISYLGVHGDALLRMVIVIAMVFGVFGQVDRYLLQSRKFSNDIVLIEEKLLQVAAYEKSINDLKSFLSHAPKSIADDAVVNHVTDIAVKNNMEILSFSPGVISSDKFSTLNRVKFKLRAKEYKDFVLFVRNLEHSGSALRVEAVSCTLEQGAGKGIINIQMEIVSVRINEQKNI